MKIQLKRSNALDGSQAKPPAENNMDSGELAINFSAQDPSLFIKDDNGTLRKLPVNDAGSIQSDWAENNTGSPAHIKNREIVNAQFNAVNAELNTKLESAPLNGDQYGHQNGGWTKIEVQEANKDSKQYVRKDGGWAEIEFQNVDLSGYATEQFATDKAVQQGLLAESNAKDYTDSIYSQTVADNNTLSADILGIVASAGYLTDAPGSIGSDGQYYARQNGTWVPFLPGTGGGGDPGGGGDVDLSGVAFLAANQTFSGFNTFSLGLAAGGTGLSMPNNVNYVPWSGILSGSQAYGTEMKWFTKTGGGGVGGGVVAFQQFGTNGQEVGNIKVGLRLTAPDTALHVASSIKANQYQNAAGRATFDGQTFTSADPLEFQADAVFFNDVVQNGRVYTSIHANQRSYGAYGTQLDDAEKAAASTIRSLLRGYIHNNRRCFCIDKSTLVSAFSNQGLDIANYDLIKEVTIKENPGLVEVDDGLDEGGHGEMTYTSIDYAALFMFLIAAQPDISQLEARIAQLEARA